MEPSRPRREHGKEGRETRYILPPPSQHNQHLDNFGRPRRPERFPELGYGSPYFSGASNDPRSGFVTTSEAHLYSLRGGYFGAPRTMAPMGRTQEVRRIGGLSGSLGVGNCHRSAGRVLANRDDGGMNSGMDSTVLRGSAFRAYNKSGADRARVIGHHHHAAHGYKLIPYSRSQRMSRSNGNSRGETTGIDMHLRAATAQESVEGRPGIPPKYNPERKLGASSDIPRTLSLGRASGFVPTAAAQSSSKSRVNPARQIRKHPVNKRPTQSRSVRSARPSSTKGGGTGDAREIKQRNNRKRVQNYHKKKKEGEAKLTIERGILNKDNAIQKNLTESEHENRAYNEYLRIGEYHCTGGTANTGDAGMGLVRGNPDTGNFPFNRSGYFNRVVHCPNGASLNPIRGIGHISGFGAVRRGFDLVDHGEARGAARNLPIVRPFGRPVPAGEYARPSRVWNNSGEDRTSGVNLNDPVGPARGHRRGGHGGIGGSGLLEGALHPFPRGRRF